MILNSSLIIIIALLCAACNNENKKPPVDLSREKHVISVPYSEIGGVKTIPVKLNGVSVDMIYDTGCAGMHLSLYEINTLIKNGKCNASDFKGMTLSTIADGSVVENAVVVLKEVAIDENLILRNVEATVSLNQSAPILLGNGVLDKVASVEVDNINQTINFKKY